MKNTCQAKHPETNESICIHNIWDHGEQLCIFHCKQKPIDEFRDHLIKEFNRVNSEYLNIDFNCAGFIFPMNVILDELHFEKRVIFDYAILENTSFRNTKFKQTPSFKAARFKGNTDFTKAQFIWADFSNAKFEGETKFNEVQFEGFTKFDNAQFRGNIDFFNAKFQFTHFSEAQFEGYTTFTIAKFKGNTIFKQAKFGRYTEFVSAKFGPYADFSNAKFEGKTYFMSAKFKNANFSDAQFGNPTNFDSAIFRDKTEFFRAQFEDNAIFSEVEFMGSVDFGFVTFKGKTIFEELKFEKAKPNSYINFSNITFEMPNQVSMKKTDLRRFLLYGTNVKDIDFLDCRWAEKGKRRVIFDEIHYQVIKEKAFAFADIEQVYRRLQNNFESSLRYSEGGDFHIGAMEMRRKQLSQNSNKIWCWLRQNILSLFALYRLISLYGERYTRTLVWMLVVLLLFPVLYLLAGFNYSTANLPSESYQYIEYDLSSIFNFSQFIKDYFRALVVSVYAFTFQRAGPFQLPLESELISIVERALSAILIALFLLAIRRRFRR